MVEKIKPNDLRKVDTSIFVAFCSSICCVIYTGIILVFVCILVVRLILNNSDSPPVFMMNTWEIENPHFLVKYNPSMYEYYNIPSLPKHIVMPSSRTETSCISFDNSRKVFCFGGYGLNDKKELTWLKDIWIWDNVQKLWQVYYPSTSFNWINRRAILWNLHDEIYLNTDSDFYSISPKQNISVWTLHENASFPFGGIFTGVGWTGYEENLWFVDEYIKSLSRYSPKRDKWEIVKHFQSEQPLRINSNVWAETGTYGSFYVFSGENLETGNCFPDVLLYEEGVGWSVLYNNTVKPNYISLPHHPGCRKNVNIIHQKRGRLLCFFGGSGHNDVWCFDKKARKWHWLSGSHEINSLPFEHENFGVMLPPLKGSSSWMDHRENTYLFSGSFRNDTVFYNLIWKLSKHVISR